MARIAAERPRLVSALLMPVEAMAAPRVMTDAATGKDMTVVALILREPGADAAQPTPPMHLIAPTNLTRREREVLALLCLRLTDAEIAAQLFLSPRTVNCHVLHLLRKLGAANRREAAATAVRQHLV